MLEVIVTPTLDDWVALHSFALWRSAELRRQLVRRWVLIPFGLLAIALGLWLAGTYPPVAISAAAGGVVVALLFPLIRRSWIGQWARQFARRNAEGEFHRFTLRLTDDGFLLRTDATSTTARWEKMKGVYVGADRLFIFATDHSAVVVSRNALDDDADYEAVRDFVAARRLPALA